jgi:hypothetical protein
VEPKRAPASREASPTEASAPAGPAPEGAWVTAEEGKKVADPVLAQAKHDDGLNVIGPHAGDPREPGMHPHPFTPEHQRIQAENETIQRLNDAMANRDVPKMRELIVAYRALDPNDVDRSQLGYGVIADCIEHPGDASLARAKDFYAVQRHSPLRRFVRRICFENRD